MIEPRPVVVLFVVVSLPLSVAMTILCVELLKLTKSTAMRVVGVVTTGVWALLAFFLGIAALAMVV